MPRVLRGAKSTPRAIRDLKPKRQLARGQQSVENDDWYSDACTAVAPSGDPPFSPRARVARGAANVSRRTTGIGRKTAKGGEQMQDNPDPDEDSHQDRHDRRAISFAKAILLVATDTYSRIRQTPRRTRRKRCIWTVIVFIAARTMLQNADLETYYTDRYATNYGNIRRASVQNERDTLPSYYSWDNSIAKVADAGFTEHTLSKLNQNPMQTDTARKFGPMPDGNPEHQRISLFPKTDLDDIVSNGDTLAVHNRQGMVPRPNPQTLAGINTHEYSPGVVSNNVGISQGYNAKQTSNLQGLPPPSYNTMQKQSSMDMQSALRGAPPPKSYISMQQQPESQAKQPSLGIQQGTTLGTLDCTRHGGPDFPPDHSELIYWQNIPSDWSFRSSFYDAKVQEAKANYFKRKKL